MEFLSDSEYDRLREIRRLVCLNWLVSPDDVQFLLRYIGELENFKWSMEH